MVRFYESDEFLASTVAEFLAQGLALEQPLVVIATPAHREAFTGQLRLKGFDTEYLVRTGRLTVLDARETLATFMVDDDPDAERFQASVGAVVAFARAGARAAVRAYGEMVDLLWQDGNTAGALRLEALWNELADTHDFSLLCAYAMQGFFDASHTDGFRQVCRHHTDVIPTERYTQLDDAARLLEVSRLQQRALALEAEIARREALERQLRATLREAETANRVKGEFLAVMSHELRTPLNAIGGYAELIGLGIHGSVTDAQRGALDRIQLSQRHLLRLIDEVLSYSRIEAGALRFTIEDVSVGDALATCEALVAPQLRSGGLSLDGPTCAPGLVVRADRERLQQIVLNLLANAVKFTPAGGRIALQGARDGDAVAIRVSDTGRGIPAGKRESIFEPFVQADATLTRAQGGIGLGLAISRDLARGMGGDLVVASEEGRGSTFTLRLPSAMG